MGPEVLRLEWYRARATFSRRWAGYLSLVLLIGFVGGLAMASVAGARRTASSFTVFWASTNPSDLVGGTGILDPQLPVKPYDPRILKILAHLPHVKTVESLSGLNILPLAKNGAPRKGLLEFTPGPGNGYASDDGYGFNQDKVAVLQGRMADPRSPSQFMLTAAEARILGVHVGSTVTMGIYTNSQITERGFGTPSVKPYRTVEERLTGIFVSNTAVVQDQADVGAAADNVFTPALVDPLLKCCVNYSESGLVLYGGSRYVPVVQKEIKTALTKLSPALGQVVGFGDPAESTVPKAQRAIRPEALALGVFGGILALACLLVAGQLIGRQVRLGGDDKAVMRAVGASPVQTWAEGLLGVTCSTAAGVLVAFVLAVGLSPLAPLGPVRPVYPDRGLSFDWTVLGLGTAVLFILLLAVACLSSYRGAPHRAGGRWAATPAPSRVLAAAGSWGLPVTALLGARFALVPGAGRDPVPVRSAVLGAVIAVVALVGTVTFAASLTSLVDHPALYGWNWDYLLGAGANMPEPQVTTLLDHDRYIQAWSGAYAGQLTLDGQETPVLAMTPGARVGPSVLTGHGLASASQVVLGPETLQALHTHLGGTVLATEGGGSRVRLRVVGTATLPALGSTGQHLEMGVGAVVDYRLLPSYILNQFGVKDAGPQTALVRLKPGTDRAAAVRSLDVIASRLSNPQNFGVTVVGVQKPAEILNYRSLGRTPAFLGAGLALGAVGALALTLVASVRRRRRDLALLKALGVTGGQLASALAWQSTIAVSIGVVAGTPLGIALGRWLWDLFARQINAVPAPAVPVLDIALIAMGALVLANLIAALPGRVAARTPTAIVLRAE